MKITRFEDIEAWKVARVLTSEIYDTTAKSGFEKDQSLQRQLRSAATSIMANIAEGFDAVSHAEFSRFLRISRRSATEIQSHLYVALDRKYIGAKDFTRLYEEADRIKRLIGGFLRYLRSPKSKPSPT